MHYLMSHPEHPLPTIVNQSSPQYADLVMAGYQPIAQGYRKQLEVLEADILEGFVMELELNEIN